MRSHRLFLRVIYIPVISFLCLTGYVIYKESVDTDSVKWNPDRREALIFITQYKNSPQGPESQKVDIRTERENKDDQLGSKKDIPTIFIISPTYTRLEQKADLTRLCQTLRLVENIHWILVEDSVTKTSLVERLLKNCKVRYTHMNALTPPRFKNIPGKEQFPRGVSQRNTALTWIRTHVDPKTTRGVVYFADDDNTYDVRIFEEMRYTKKVSVWPVGLIAGGKFESPIVKDGKVVGWIFFAGSHRRFPIDMASFAFNVRLLFLHPKAEFSYKAKPGTQESTILLGLKVTMADMEPKANNCTQVMVWHTRTQRSSLINQAKLQKKYNNSVNFALEV